MLDESGSEERESRQMPSQQQLEEDDERYYEHNNGNQQHHHYRRQDEEQVEDLGPEIFIPQPEFFTRMPTSELRYDVLFTPLTNYVIIDSSHLKTF